ncbi:von Willebrand factor type A domain protein [Selenomonas sp. FOBRC6]|uniref:vWA domain-containing protein n=1 Tax=Selenomonas sp. FOBRC6 TaxID=936572 RepID=UPI0002781961|nr:vWA domain-containing protein [Selenomonas sp. FOBRC6]EJO23251.1 von Willebrand factor type A domain protein [Selenomonas sp. FOBRC6]
MTEAKTNGQTELVFILDRSGSMAGLESDTIGGFNGMLTQHRSEGGDVLVSTVLFDHEDEVIHDRVRIAEVPTLTDKEYYTRGSTALLDAMGGAIHHIKNVHKYARPEDRPARTMFIITTDGMENSSTRYTADQVRAMVKQQEEAGWAFVFLGANIDAVQVAGGLGIRAENAVEFACDAAGVRENFTSLAAMTCAFSAVGEVPTGWAEKIGKHLAKQKSGRS